MSDPYRPSNYAPTYNPSSYVPHDTYASGALTTRPTSSDRYEDARPYYPSQSNLELSQNTAYRRTSDTYLSPTDEYPSHRHHRKSSRSHSRHRDDKDKDGKSGRSRSHSRGKEWGATAVGGAAGAFIGNEIGHGPLGIGAGLIAGAIGAHELERRHEKHQEKKRGERDGGGRGDGEKAHRKRRSSGGLLDNVKDKVEGFLNPDGEKEKRRSRSSVGGSSGGGGGRRRGGYDSYSDSEEERYERKSGGGRRRDDY